MEKSIISVGTSCILPSCLFLYVPIVYLLAYSFNKGDTMNSFTGFSMRHFAELFSDTRLIVILLETFMLAFLSALIATAVGTFGALSIYYVKKRQQRMALLSLNNILMVSPDVIIGASFLILFDDRIVFRRHRARILDGAFIARCIQHSDRCSDGFAQASGNERVDGFCGI